MVETAGRITLWGGIEVFVAVADERSISAAARRLGGASASAVSQQLTNLEAAVGASLVDRSARPPLVLTPPAGGLFRRRAQTILNEAEQARVELAAQDLAVLTRFRLGGVIEDFDADVTPALLTEMAGGELAATRFLLETGGASHRLFDQLEARALDVVVCADLGVAGGDWMEVHPLLEEPFVAAVPPKGGAVRRWTSCARCPDPIYLTPSHGGAADRWPSGAAEPAAGPSV